MKTNTSESKLEKVASTIKKIIQLFEEGNVPKAIAIATFPPFDVPSAKWSLLNRLIMMAFGTSDGRGWHQWKEVGRNIKKGSKAFYILAPRLCKKEAQEENKEEENPQYICTGFLSIPIFAVEQTEGEPLQYEKLELPNLPLLEKAREWNIDVKSISFQGRAYGSYRSSAKEEIRLASPHENIFFHELAHAAHARVLGSLKTGQHPFQEIVAELSAQVLSEIVGTQTQSTLGNTYEYIQHYASKMKKDVSKACLSVVSDVEKVLEKILE